MTADPLATYTYPPGYCREFWDAVTQMYQARADNKPFDMQQLSGHVQGCEQCRGQEARELPRIGGEG